MSNSKTFKLAGDGYWGAEADRSVTITGFNIDYYIDPKSYEQVAKGTEGAVIGHVTVDHDSTWDVYTDTGFQEAAANYTNIMGLDFTEQGMQEDNLASMEV